MPCISHLERTTFQEQRLEKTYFVRKHSLALSCITFGIIENGIPSLPLATLKRVFEIFLKGVFNFSNICISYFRKSKSVSVVHRLEFLKSLTPLPQSIYRGCWKSKNSRVPHSYGGDNFNTMTLSIYFALYAIDQLISKMYCTE